MRKEYKILAMIFIVGLSVRFIFMTAMPLRYWDEAVYADLGRDLSKNPFDYSFADKNWTDWASDDWPKAGFRAPLLPYTLSVFYFFNAEVLIELLMPIIGAASSVVLFILAKRMFNERVALYSSIFLALLPLHIIFSGRIMTDVFSNFFAIIAALFFWKGFEEGENKSKLLFGMFMALSILARYTMLILMPVYAIYLTIRKRWLSFLKDSYLWKSAAIFVATLSPWLIYGILEYGNPLGQFMHGIKSSSYWGGIQPWYFFIQHFFDMFSVISMLFLISLVLMLSKKECRKKPNIIFLAAWFLLFFTFISAMPHKEERFAIPLVVPLVVFGALLIEKMERYRNIALLSVISVMIISIGLVFTTIYQNQYPSDICLLDASIFLSKVNDDPIILSTESPIINYYSNKEVRFFATEDLDSVEKIKEIAGERTVYVVFTTFSVSMQGSKGQEIKNFLDSNLNFVYKCPDNSNSTIIYKYN